MFFSLQQSAFLHALGSAIGNSLWQVAALWLVFAAISGLSKLNAANRYRLATAFSVAGFAWFVYTLASTYFTQPFGAEPSNFNTYQHTALAFVNEGFSNKVAFVYHSFLASLASLSPYISCAYLLVWLLLATRLVNGFRQVRQFGTQGLGRAGADVKLFVQKHAALLQIKQKVRTFTSEFVQGPLTIGFFRPIILLPIASMAHLSTAQVEAILLHELAHIKRHDYLVNIFVQFAEICLFFNPFMRLLLKQVKQERENCCDDYVLQFQYNAADYAKALLGIAQNRTATLLAMAARNSQFQLLNRVKRMVAPQPQTFNYRQQLYMLLMLTILGFCVAIVVPQPVRAKRLAKNTVTETKTFQRKKEAKVQKTEEAPADGIDLVKSALSMIQLSKNINTPGFENNGKEIERLGKKMEAQAKKISDEALQSAKPAIENAEMFAKDLSEKIEADVDAKKMIENGDINGYVNRILDKVNRGVSKLNVLPTAPLALPAPPAPPIINKANVYKQKMLERKANLDKEWAMAQQTAIRKNMDSLQAALGESLEAQQQSLRILQKSAALKKKEDWDMVAFEDVAKQAGLALAQKNVQKAFRSLQRIHIPNHLQLPNIDQDIQIRFDNNAPENMANETDEDVENENARSKAADGHQSASGHDVKRHNVIIVNVSSSK